MHTCYTYTCHLNHNKSGLDLSNMKETTTAKSKELSDERFQGIILDGFFEDPRKMEPLRTRRHFAFIGTFMIFLATAIVFLVFFVTSLMEYIETETVTISQKPISGQVCSGLKYFVGRYVNDYGLYDTDGLDWPMINYALQVSASTETCNALTGNVCEGYYEYLRQELYDMPEICRSDWYAPTKEAAYEIDGMPANCPAAYMNFDSMTVDFGYFPMTWSSPDIQGYDFIYPTSTAGNGIVVSIANTDNVFSPSYVYPLAWYLTNPFNTYDDLISKCSTDVKLICDGLYAPSITEVSNPFSCVKKTRIYKSFFDALSVAMTNSRALLTISTLVLCYVLPWRYPVIESIDDN